MIVLDASAVIELLLATARGARISAAIAGAGETLVAPHLLDIEVAQVLRRLESARILTPARALDALSDLTSLDITRYPHDVLLDRVWQLRGSLTAYDAAYVSLAEATGAPLLTCDAKLARARGHHAVIHLER